MKLILPIIFSVWVVDLFAYCLADWNMPFRLRYTIPPFGGFIALIETRIKRKPSSDWKAKYEEAWAIATDLYNAHSGSAGQWERSRERYEKAIAAYEAEYPGVKEQA